MSSETPIRHAILDVMRSANKNGISVLTARILKKDAGIFAVTFNADECAAFIKVNGLPAFWDLFKNLAVEVEPSRTNKYEIYCKSTAP
jgi:hypothetical protein